MRNTGIVVVVACSALLSQMSSPAYGQSTPESCIQTLDTGEREMRAFHNDLRRESIDFGLNDASIDLWGEGKWAVKNISNPKQGAANVIQRVKDGLKSYVDSVEQHKAFMAELSACIVPGSGCNLLEFAKRHHEATKQWIQSLSEGSTSTAIDRVDKARNLYATYSDRSLNMATGSMGSAMRCMSEQQAQAMRAANQAPVELVAPAAASGASNPEPASAGQPATATPTASPAKAEGSKDLLWAILGGGGATAGLIAAKGSGLDGGGGDCSYPDVTFDACFDPRQGGSSPACQTSLKAVDKYCACRGMKRGSGTAGFNQCVP